jgi:hypothetical protein
VHLLSPAIVQPYSFGGWGLAFWVGSYGACEEHELITNTDLCRSAVAELLQLLEHHGSVELTMPPAERLEVEVEAPLRWNGVTYRLGFNTLDGAVSVYHAERAPLDRLLAAVEGLLHAASNDLH